MLFLYELKKLLLTPAIAAFLIICAVVNTFIVVSSYVWQYEPANLAEQADVFDGFDAREIAERYIGEYSLSGGSEANIREKYAKLQPVIDAKAARDDSMSEYFGVNTRTLHTLLFKQLFGAIAAESCVAALFFALLGTGYEQTRNTESIVCASRTGRRILLPKLLAALIASAVFLAALTAVTLAVAFAKFGYASVLGDNVSSLYNTAVQGNTNNGIKPLITLRSFTVGGLIAASLGLTLALAWCFALFGFAVGAAIRGGYGATLASIAVLAASVVAAPLFAVGSEARYAFASIPPGLILGAGTWFTDGGAMITHLRFETTGTALSLAVLAALSLAAAAYYKRRDLK
ncbi:MAG: hypothetical protein LBS90_05980 [Oscillospiraceae bacterium]|jgi:hypothetical protein|nr:hypothetical protein [Oscillospiraceae bacterium]